MSEAVNGSSNNEERGLPCDRDGWILFLLSSLSRVIHHIGKLVGVVKTICIFVFFIFLFIIGEKTFTYKKLHTHICHF